MNVLGIDPGPTRTAWVLLSPKSVTAWGIDDNDVVLDVMQNQLQCRALAKNGYCQAAIEVIEPRGMPVGAETFWTMFFAGRIYECLDNSIDVRTLKRSEIKLHLCGTSRAKDGNVRQALIDRWGPGKDIAIGRKATPGPLYGIRADAWAALAVAVTLADKLEVEHEQETKRKAI